MYTSILQEYLVLFIRDVYPDGHKFIQDNDSKHTSRHAQAFFTENEINWWKTPPESPDANLIENLWHELKASRCLVYVYTHTTHMYTYTIQSIQSPALLLFVWPTVLYMYNTLLNKCAIHLYVTPCMFNTRMFIMNYRSFFEGRLNQELV